VPSGRFGRGAAVVAVTSLVAIVLGCTPSGPAPSSSTGPSPSASPTATLTDTAWSVTSINGAPMLANASPTMTFSADGQVAGTGGCNQYSAPYQTDGDKLTVGPISSTLMLCEGAVGAQETAFFNGLSGADTWLITGNGDLELNGAAKVFASKGAAGSPSPPASGAGLGGTAWNLAEMGGTADFARILPTIEFGEDGSVSGFAGCNTFSGTFTTEGTTLTMSPLATTKIGCQRPASAVEAEYLNALSGVTNWEIDAGGRLTLGGPVLLHFTNR
jgi:heat shock protein HslJ